MKALFKIPILFSILFLTMTGSVQAITCKIIGQIIGRDSKSLLLFRATEDPDRVTKTIIPVNNGKFEYTLNAPFIEAYFLMFQDESEIGTYRYIYFFSEPGTTVFKLHSLEECNQDEIIGGKLTSEYYSFIKMNSNTYQPQKMRIRDSIAELKKRDGYFSIEFIMQQAKLNEAMSRTEAENSNERDLETAVSQTQVVQNMINTGDYVTQKGKALNDKMDSIIVLENRHRLDYIKNNPTLVSYYFLIEYAKAIEDCQGITINDIKSILPMFTVNYPGHPYTNLIAVMVESLSQIKIGGAFYDFTAPDLNGKLYKVSEIIEGKYAVIDLWASWCGPCINGSRNFLPIYEEFKDKGFTICGVAREYKNTDALRQRIHKEKFPWVNLVELDDKNQIWLHYSVQGGGRKFLVDNKGVIIAIEPSPEEIREILNEKLNQ